MREVEVCRKNIKWGSDENHEVIYYLTVDEMLDGSGYRLLENYGLGIRIEGGDNDCLRSITSNSGKILDMLDMIADGTVTPITLRDVVSDLIEVVFA